MRIRTDRLEKIFQESYENRDGLKQIADYIIEAHTKGLTDEQKLESSEDLAVGIAVGEALSRNYNLFTGVAIGVLATGISIMVVNKLIKKFEEKEEEE